MVNLFDSFLTQQLQFIIPISQFKIIGNISGNWISVSNSNQPSLQPTLALFQLVHSFRVQVAHTRRRRQHQLCHGFATGLTERGSGRSGRPIPGRALPHRPNEPARGARPLPQPHAQPHDQSAQRPHQQGAICW